MKNFLIIFISLYLNVSLTIPKLNIAYQGVAGSYSYITSNTLFPNATFIPHNTFEQAMTTVEVGGADFAVIPI